MGMDPEPGDSDLVLGFVVDAPVFRFRAAHQEGAAFDPHKAVIHLFFPAFFHGCCAGFGRRGRHRGRLFRSFEVPGDGISAPIIVRSAGKMKIRPSPITTAVSSPISEISLLFCS